MNFLELRTQVRIYLNDNLDGTGFYVDDIVKPAVNAANNKVNSLLKRLYPDNFVLNYATQSTIANTKRYAMPIDATYLHRVELVESATSDKVLRVLTPFPLPRGNFQYNEAVSYLNFDSPGEPTHFLVRQQEIDMFPTPNDVYVMKIWFDQRGAQLILDTDIPPVDVDFHPFLAAYAAHIASFSNPAERRDDLMELYKEHEAELIESKVGRAANMEIQTNRGLFGL